ncbi:ACT domain-containing protein [soil metagenome]
MTAAGEHDLDVLLASLDPQLDPEPYVFASVGPGPVDPSLEPIVTVVEAEGTTLVLHAAAAQGARERGSELAESAPMTRITLLVHSSLDAVGLTAAVAGALADAGISCNVVAGYFHDHLFVPEARSDEACALLRGLSQS